MASWLKAAEDLFEVVDRRAKLVVGEKSDEPPVPNSGSNERDSQTKRARQKAKKKLPSKETLVTVDVAKGQPTPETLQSQADPDRNLSVPLNELKDINLETTNDQSGNDAHQSADSKVENSLSGATSSDATKPIDGPLDREMSPSTDAVNINQSDDVRKEEESDAPSQSQLNSVVTMNADSHDDSNQNMTSGDAISSETVEVAVSPPQVANAPEESGSQENVSDTLTEPVTQNKEPPEKQTTISSEKVQEQLDEAQGLLKSAVSTGQSKEARLARVCAGLSTRLQEYKSENAQLEELLTAERELSKSYEARIKQLQQDLSLSKTEVTRVESSMAEALAAKNAEIEAHVNSIDTLKKQAALSEGNLATLQANMESIMRNRELTETRMMQALREELAATERRAEEERAAHNAIKLSAREREFELEQRAIEASSSLAKIQRIADDRAGKVSELEQKVALLEVECASLNQELQDTEARVRREQKKSPQDANQAIQAWQDEVERARQGQREAERKLSSMEAEVQKMRVEMAAMKRDAEHYSRQEHMELEKRYRELTDLLYYKQTQLETMATEKAAAEFQLEKELKHLHESQLEAERNRSSRRASSSWEEDTDIKALEPLPLYHRHLAGASVQLQKAAKLLDTGAVRATRFLWRYPTARVILLFYLVFVHLFLMYLLHRLQEQAERFASNDLAESMGLFNRTLP